MTLLRFMPEALKERLRRRAGAVTAIARLENLRRAGFNPRRIIDAGAYHGEWSQMAHRVFPEAALLLIEAQPHLGVRLREFCATLPDARFRPALLGATAGTVRFVLNESNSRIIPDSFDPGPSQVQMLSVEPLAAIAAAEGFSDCDLLKLDLQGHELAALAGAGELFGRVSVIITEVSWLRIGEVPLIQEVFLAFAAHGYQPYDIWGGIYRQRDGALWQTDVMFVRTDLPLLASQSWD